MLKWKIKLPFSVNKFKDSPINLDKFKLSIQDINNKSHNFKKLSETLKSTSKICMRLK